MNNSKPPELPEFTTQVRLRIDHRVYASEDGVWSWAPKFVWIGEENETAARKLLGEMRGYGDEVRLVKFYRVFRTVERRQQDNTPPPPPEEVIA